jgi:hypothetical protein
MSQPDGASPVGNDKVFTFTNPARTVTVATAWDAHAIDIALTPAALNVAEADLAKEIVAAAKFSRDRSRAALASDRVRESVARGDDEDDCRRYIYKVQNMPTDGDIESEITAHYGLTGEAQVG